MHILRKESHVHDLFIVDTQSEKEVRGHSTKKIRAKAEKG